MGGKTKFKDIWDFTAQLEGCNAPDELKTRFGISGNFAVLFYPGRSRRLFENIQECFELQSEDGGLVDRFALVESWDAETRLHDIDKGYREINGGFTVEEGDRNVRIYNYVPGTVEVQLIDGGDEGHKGAGFTIGGNENSLAVFFHDCQSKRMQAEDASTFEEKKADSYIATKMAVLDFIRAIAEMDFPFILPSVGVAYEPRPAFENVQGYIYGLDSVESPLALKVIYQIGDNFPVIFYGDKKQLFDLVSNAFMPRSGRLAHDWRCVEIYNDKTNGHWIDGRYYQERGRKSSYGLFKKWGRNIRVYHYRPGTVELMVMEKGSEFLKDIAPVVKREEPSLSLSFHCYQYGRMQKPNPQTGSTEEVHLLKAMALSLPGILRWAVDNRLTFMILNPELIYQPEGRESR